MQTNVMIIGLDASQYLKQLFSKMNQSTVANSDYNQYDPDNEMVSIWQYIQQKKKVDEQTIIIKWWNPSGMEKYQHLRRTAYSHINIFVIVCNYQSLQNLQEMNQHYVDIRKQTSTNQTIVICRLQNGTEMENKGNKVLENIKNRDNNVLFTTQFELSDFIARVSVKYFKKQQNYSSQNCSLI